MKIIQVTPGNIPIPPNGWGAVEKIIWEYKLSLEKLGYEVEILYLDDIQYRHGQIIHVHMANLANILYQKGIPYVFSLHDHHVEYFGKDSAVYKENYRAIKNSKLTFVHSKHLIKYFDELEQIVYLPHGVNLEDYPLIDRSEKVRIDNPKLLMMANNGMGGDRTIDRKGFLLGIECAKKFGFEIHIMCPSSNQTFFDFWKPDYKNLTILYDLDYKESIDRMKNYQLFLHPSNLEAGHPNLTILEALSVGMPVVGVCNESLPGLINCSPEIDSLEKAIGNAFKKYDSLTNQIIDNRLSFSWDLVVGRMIQNYKKFYQVSERDQLLYNYNKIKKTSRSTPDTKGIIINFSSRRAFCKVGFSFDGTVVFSDKKTGRVIYHSLTKKSTNIWSSAFRDGEFIEWVVEVKEGSKILHKEELSLENKRILLVIESFDLEPDTVKSFVEKTRCYLTIKTRKNYYIDGVQIDSQADENGFYYSLNERQLLDYFNQKEKISQKTIIVSNSDALGDKIVSVRYAQEFALMKNIVCDLYVKGVDIFDPSDFPNLNLLEKKEHFDENFTNIIYLDYKFDRPVMKGFSDLLELEYKELRPLIKRSKLPRPIRDKYVCLGVQSTSQCKYWNYPNGWEILSKMLRKIDLIPVAVDLHEVFGIEGWWNSLPHSSVRKTGLSFDEVVNIIQHSAFFIGVSSGLSWVAHALGKEVVMISGVTSADNEFTQDIIRIQNQQVCNSCFTKTTDWKFDPGDWTWCPEHKGSTKWFECTITIEPEFIFEKLKQNGLI